MGRRFRKNVGAWGGVGSMNSVTGRGLSVVRVFVREEEEGGKGSGQRRKEEERRKGEEGDLGSGASPRRNF